MSGAQFDVVVVGNVGIDTSIYGADLNSSVESHFTENLDCVGQAGGYASRGYAQLGLSAAFIGYVGDDHNGRFIRDELARDGIDTSALFTDPEGTSRSINVMFADGRRKNFYDGKGHMHLTPDLEICRSVLGHARLAHFNIPNWARSLLPAARDRGLTVACDIQDVVDPEDAYRDEFVRAADILFFSTVNHGDVAPLMQAFSRSNPERIVVAGMGAEGCAVRTQDGVQYFAAVGGESPVVDTNGAGDSLAVGFLSSYVLERRGLRESVARGQIAARHTCGQKASSSHLITAEQLERRFQAMTS